MASLVEPIDVQVTFALPDWFPPERLDYVRHVRYGPGHAWAGQVESTHYENSASDAIFRLKGVKELCTDPHAKWVTFEVSPRSFHRRVAKIRGKLERLLRRYKEYREVRLA